jgi:hypothetical protein
MKRYLWNIVQAFNRLFNAILAGTDKEYMSSRAFRYKDTNKVAGFAYKCLNSLEENHCEKAYEDCQKGFDPEDAAWK